MLSTFLGLQTSLRGLEAAQAGINTVSHNIDNANTPGYARERVNFTEMPALDPPSLTNAMAGQVGQGVTASSVQRITSPFLNEQYRQQNAALGEGNVEQSTLNQVSGIMNEPSSSGISTALQNFYKAWDKLGSNPSDLSSRTAVVDAAKTLTDVMNQTASQLSSLHSSLGTSVSNSVGQVNGILSQIASVSNQIVKVQETGNQPNDLMNQRDNLLNKLSKYTTFTTSTKSVSSGGISYDEFSLSLPGSASTGGTTPTTVIDGTKTDFSNGNPPTNLTGKLAVASNTGAVQIVSNGGSSVNLASPSGQFQGYQKSLTDVQNYQNDLDVLAQSLAGGGASTLTSSWTIPASAISSPPYNSMTFDGKPLAGAAGTGFLASQTPPITEQNGQYTIPSGTKIQTTLGSMSVTLVGKMTVPSTATSAQLNGVTATLPSGSTLSPSPGQQLPSGTTLHVSGLNQLLQLGYSENGQGSALFGVPASADGQPITASNISVTAKASTLSAGTSVDATTGLPVSGDGTLATVVANTQNAKMSFPNPQSANGASSSTTITGTLSDYLTAVVGQLGLQGQNANNQVSLQTTLTQQLNNQIQSVSGVSVNEEMTKMISYQQGYSASAKMISTINDMLTQLMQNV